MATTTQLYNSALLRLMTGSLDIAGHTFKAMLLVNVTPNLANTTLSAVKQSGSEITGTNWPTGGIALTNLTIEASGTSGAKLTADNIDVVIPSGLGPYSHVVVYDDTDGADWPLLIITFDSPITVLDGYSVGITWSPDGIVVLTVG